MKNISYLFEMGSPAEKDCELASGDAVATFQALLKNPKSTAGVLC